MIQPADTGRKGYNEFVMDMEMTVKKESDAQGQSYPVIDLAKFVCSILVFMIHVPLVKDPSGSQLSTVLYYVIDFYLTRIAVPFFFVASGFLMFRKRIPEKYLPERTKKYLVRLLRLYLIWTVIYFPLSAVYIINDEAGIVHGVLTYLRNLIFAGSYVHLWYLPALIFAMFLVSFLITKKIRPGVILMISAGFYFLGLFAQSWFGFILPLRELTPSLWHFLQNVEKIIVTTRDGLFEGFLFVSMGMYIALTHTRIAFRKSFPLFIGSFLLMGLEILVLFKARYIRENDMYLFLAPSAFFLFCFLLEIHLPPHPAYVTLRGMSSVLFYSHFWFEFLVSKALTKLCGQLAGGFFEFVIVLVISLAFSWTVVRLSEYKRFGWLKALYN